MGRLKIPKFGRIIISPSAQGAIYSRTRAPFWGGFETFLAFIPTLQLIYDLFRTVPSMERKGIVPLPRAVGSPSKNPSKIPSVGFNY